MEASDQIKRIVDVLESVGTYKRLTRVPLRERGFSFETLLVGNDPMSIIVIEYKERPDVDFFKNIVRELRTFVWSLFNEGKRNMVSLILVLGVDLDGQQRAELTKSLRGTCRLYTVSADMTPEQVRAELVSLGAPEFIRIPNTTGEADKLALELASLKGRAKQEFARQLVELVKGSSSAQEVTRKLLKEYKERIREVENAAADVKD